MRDAARAFVARHIRGVVFAAALLLVVTALGVAVLFYVFPGLDVWLFWKVYGRYVSAVANATGLNSYLVTALALLAFVPFYYGATLVLYHPLNARKRRLGLMILLALAVLYNGGLYAATRETFFAFSDGQIGKYYALTPAGVRFFDRPGVDPDYGITLKPVTADNVRDLKLRTGDAVAVDPHTRRFFNPNTGDPELWFHADATGALEFYGRPGFHPGTGESLAPVTRETYQKWRDAEEQKRKDEERKAKEEAARLAREAKEREGRQPVMYYVPGPGYTVPMMGGTGTAIMRHGIGSSSTANTVVIYGQQ